MARAGLGSFLRRCARKHQMPSAQQLPIGALVVSKANTDDNIYHVLDPYCALDTMHALYVADHKDL